MKTDATLRATLLDRLGAIEKGEAWDVLVLAALDGPPALQEALDAAPSEKKPAAAEPAPAPKAAYLKSIAVEGFRGIGKKVPLELHAGPGLTLVVGRNGSGKSSFAEALELLLTRANYRWEGRTKVWQEGWRNLHSPACSIEATFFLEGKKGPAVLRRAWADADELAGGQTSLQVQGEAKTDPSALGWEQPLATYRPFLSYNELGSLLDEGPSALYDAMAQILGLEELAAAQSALAEERKAREKAQKESDNQRLMLVDLLKQKEDPRAKALLDIVDKKQCQTRRPTFPAQAHPLDSRGGRILRPLRTQDNRSRRLQPSLPSGQRCRRWSSSAALMVSPRSASAIDSSSSSSSAVLSSNLSPEPSALLGEREGSLAFTRSDLRLDIPRPLPRLERPLKLQQRVLKALQLDDLADLLAKRQRFAFAAKLILAPALPGDQLRRGPRTNAGRGRSVRARHHAS